MNARISLENKLSPAIVAYIEELSKAKAIEYAHAKLEELREKEFLFHLMLFCARSHDLYGHGESRNKKLIEAIITDRDAEDGYLLLKHTLDHMHKIGLSFLVEEWKKYD